MNFVWFILVGIAAGWLAGRIMKDGSSGVLGNLVLGVVGAVLGGFVFRLFGLSANNLIGELVTATVGAVVLIAALRAVKK